MARDYLQEFEDLRRSWRANENNVGPGSAIRSPATVDQAKQYYKIVQNQAALDALNGIVAPKSESFEEYSRRRQLESMPQGISQTVDYGKAADSTKEDTTVKVEDSSLNEEANNKKTPYELALEKYNKELSDYDNELNTYKQRSAALNKDFNDKQALYLDNKTNSLPSAERMGLYNDLKTAVNAAKEYSTNYKNPFTKPTAPNQKDFEELINKPVNNTDDNINQKDFEDLLNNNNNKNDLIAGYDQSGKAGYGDPFNIQWPKSGTPGPGYKAPESKPPEPKPPTKSASSETPESRYENFVAQVTPGPSGYTDPRSYDPRGIIPIITPGSKFKPGEGYNLIDPFKKSPSTGPGLSETPEKTYENFVAKVTPQTSSVSKDETLNKYDDLLTQLKKSKIEQTEQRTSPTAEFSNTVGLLNELNAFDSIPEENTSVLIADNQTGRLSDKLPPNIRDARNWARENPGKYNPFLPDNVNRYFMGVPKQV